MVNFRNNNIIFAGDSWGCGVFKTRGIKDISHGGTAEFFSDYGYNVTNLSLGGISNLTACSRLEEYLKYNCFNQHIFKGIIFWQTEFFREIWYFDSEDRDRELAAGYQTLKTRWINMPYYKLSEISLQYNVPVYIIGGASDTVMYENFSRDHPGVEIICQSLVNLLVNHNPRVDQPVYTMFLNGWVDDFFPLIKPRCQGADLEHLTKDIDLGQQRIKQIDDLPELFYPDGIHPNKVGHDRIFKFLLENIPGLKLK